MPMEQSARPEKNEQESIDIARIALQQAGESCRNTELYRDLLYNAAKNKQHGFEDFVLERLAQIHTGKNLMPIISKSLFEAAAQENVIYLKKILPYVSIYGGSRALHVAARNGKKIAAQFLLENKALPEFRSRKGKTALAIGIENDQEEVVKFLLEEHVLPGKAAVKQWANPNGQAPYNFSDLLTWTITLKYGLKYVRLLLEHGAKADGQSILRAPLLYCATNNYYQAIEVLMEFGALPNIQIPRKNNTPLIQAVRNGHVESVEALIGGAKSHTIEIACTLAKEWDNNYLTFLPADIRNEIKKMRPIAVDHTVKNKAGKSALAIADDLAKRTDHEKDDRYHKIVAILKKLDPK